MTTIYTLGHSSHDWPTFQRLLACADIGAVADLRSNPASRLAHFNRAPLKERLNASGVAYLPFGDVLGGRPANGEAADYEKMSASAPFLEGLARIEAIAPRTRLALLCSEYDPLTCHRCLLVGRRLAERGASIVHILRDGALEPNEAMEERLLALTRRALGDIFASRAERLAAAYLIQGQRTAKARR
jgi:uncharacterized protein (DUF488 family)